MAARMVARISLVVVVAAVPLPSAADNSMSFKSVDVDLPFGDPAYPDGAGADLATNNCLGCHSAAMVLNQPPLPQSTWQTEVDKMRTAYKAPIANTDVGPIVDYLTRIKGTK